MTSEPENIISFPYQVKDPTRPASEMTDDEIVWVCRNSAAEILNAVAAGKTELTEQDRKDLHGLNEFCIKYGYPPIDGDF